MPAPLVPDAAPLPPQARQRRQLLLAMAAGGALPLQAVAQPSPKAEQAKTNAAPVALSPAEPAALPQARQHFLASQATGRRYRIQVSRVGPRPPGGYPVLYVLDGDAMFPVAAMAALGMAMRADENGISPMLLVGVGYEGDGLLDEQARAEDYTPPAPDLSNTGDRRAQRQGGAERFLQFLHQELQPTVAQAYPVDAGRQALLGHSYGGLFALYALLQGSPGWQTYIASSPSIWWNQGHIHQLRAQFAEQQAQRAAHAPRWLQLSIGEYEQTPSPLIDAQSPRARMMQQRGQVDQARQFVQALQRDAVPQLSIDFRHYPQATHATAALHALIDGLRFASASWRAAA
ncbi:alpha/beta hydrolase [Vandammella animalimorsus]|uniref:alpha/beta hydrolase n=1 Tax=Vandammella animalimorsus TaxID=2029117 RepID=UPI001EEF3DCE|nr:alpha/beta hydrolase-fold protein [Vandammella animalimorsus]